MLKFKNAQTLSRAEMKNLMGGANNAAKPICADLCQLNGGCSMGQTCEAYPCVVHGVPTLGFKCAFPS